MKKLTVILFIFVLLISTSVYADRDIAALGNLQGVYVNLKIHDRIPQGMAKHRINQDALLKHFKNELIEKCKAFYT